MASYKNFPGTHFLQIGLLGPDGCPSDPTVPGNAFVMPGKMAKSLTYNLNQEEQTIESQCDEDYVQTTDTADADLAFCEFVRPELVSLFNSQPSVVANGVIFDPLDATADPVPATCDATGIDCVEDALDEIGFISAPLGEAGNCCPSATEASNGLYMLAFRCVGKCGNKSITSANGNPVYSVTAFPNITSATLSNPPLGWDGTATAFDEWIVKLQFGNGKMSCFDLLFPGYAPAADGGPAIEPVTPSGQWLTDKPLPFGAQCACEVLDTFVDADVALPVHTPPAAPAQAKAAPALAGASSGSGSGSAES